MEDPVDEWENEQYPVSGYGEEEVSQSKISRVLSGGLWLGKKLMITGFFVSSAPVVLPPLLVLSAVGFAVSIPFGAVLAGYTCTEKLMSKLLPMPQSSGMLDYEEQALVMDGAEEDVGDYKERFAIEEEQQQQENVMPEMYPNKPEAQSEALLEDEKPPQPVVTRVVVAKPVEGEIEGSSVKNEEREVLEAESRGLLEKIRDEGQSAKKNKKTKKERLKKSLGLMGGKNEEKSATKSTKQTEKNPEILHKTDEISPDEQINRNIEINDVLDDRENAPVVETRNHSEGKDQKQGKHGPEMQYTAVSIKRENMPVESSRIHREITGNQVKEPAAKGATEISLSEKNLWDQINAMRVIVGYKMELHPTITGELKALYLFTGVQPPSSFKDFSDMKDSHEKLRFLMSIVGVK